MCEQNERHANECYITHLFDELVFRSLRVQLLSCLDYDGELVLDSLVICRRGVETILEFLYRESSSRHGRFELEWWWWLCCSFSEVRL